MTIQALLLQENTNNIHNQEEQQQSLDRLVQGIKAITGYEFHNPNLLQEAFTHNSQDSDEDHDGETSSVSYKRLEYMGDAVLSLSITEELFKSYEDLCSGDLTRLRAANVDTEKLARVALNHELYNFLRHNIPQLSTQISEFTSAVVDHPLHSWGLIDAPKVLADIVESLIGAIYIDSNSSLDTTGDVVKSLLQPLITPETLRVHPVTRLQEICQKRGLKLNVRDMWKKNGTFEYVVEDVEIVGNAKYEAKRNIAKNRAAYDAYLQLVEMFHI